MNAFVSSFIDALLLKVCEIRFWRYICTALYTCFERRVVSFKRPMCEQTSFLSIPYLFSIATLGSYLLWTYSTLLRTLFWNIGISFTVFLRPTRTHLAIGFTAISWQIKCKRLMDISHKYRVWYLYVFLTNNSSNIHSSKINGKLEIFLFTFIK